MTREEFDNLKVGDKIIIKHFADEGKVFVLQPESRKINCKVVTANKVGFNAGGVFYRFQDTEIFKNGTYN